MMRRFRLALAQINPTVGDIEGNVGAILLRIEQARDLGVDLLAFPEMAVPGYPPEDLLFKPSFILDNIQGMRQVAAASEGIAVVVGFVDATTDIFNSAAVAWDGALVGVYHKMYLPNYGVFDEDRYFKRGSKCPVFDIAGVRVGVNICEDIWYPVGPIAVQRAAGAQLIVNINASPSHFGKRSYREKMVATRAADNGLYVAYVNTVGGQDELVFDGGSVIFDQAGELVRRGLAFEEDLVVADLDIETVYQACPDNPELRLQNDAILRQFEQPEVISVSPYRPRERPSLAPRDNTPLADGLAEMYRALVVGTGDYVRKNGFDKVIIGLSGGVDSSLTACVAVDALGKDNVLGVAMPSRFSSEGSMSDAKDLVERLGMQLWTVPIEPAHAAFLEMLDPHFSKTASNVAEENLQARVRGTVLMALSNKFGWLVLTTGNKSELAMGYATLYGDMAGGFAVIKDVPKTMVYELARWRNELGDHIDVIPQSVLEKAPSAELKPNQSDQDTLPPYSELDPVVKAYVEEDRSYQEMLDMGFDLQIVREVIASVDRNEYKRRQAPPGVKTSPKAFGKDRRLPIVSKYRQF